MEYELPEKKFNWKVTDHGYEITLNTNLGRVDFNQSNTALFAFPDQPEMQHIFRKIEDRENEVYGLYIWRDSLDHFYQLYREMKERLFYEIVGEPTEGDYNAFMTTKIGDLALAETVPIEWLENN